MDEATVPIGAIRDDGKSNGWLLSVRLLSAPQYTMRQRSLDMLKTRCSQQELPERTIRSLGRRLNVIRSSDLDLPLLRIQFGVALFDRSRYFFRRFWGDEMLVRVRKLDDV